MCFLFRCPVGILIFPSSIGFDFANHAVKLIMINLSKTDQWAIWPTGYVLPYFIQYGLYKPLRIRSKSTMDRYFTGCLSLSKVHQLRVDNSSSQSYFALRSL